MPLTDEPAMVLTPARVSQPQSEAPASVTVIDRNLIEASGARELYEVLRLVPGMSAVKVDGNVPTVAYHGTQARDSRRMLVLLTGLFFVLNVIFTGISLYLGPQFFGFGFLLALAVCVLLGLWLVSRKMAELEYSTFMLN